jgi:hypothetical protein
MSSELVTLIVMVGGHGRSPVERLVGEAHHAIARDTIEKCAGAEWCERIVVSTDSPELADGLRDYPVDVDLDTGSFHFGQTLRRLIREYRIERVFYVGGGSAPLLRADEFAEYAQAILAGESALAANNYFSSDLIAFSPASAIERIELPDTDNALAMLLHRDAGLPNLSPNRTVGSQFDVDTPTDLLILAEHPRAGPNARAYLDQQNLESDRIREVGRLFTNPQALVTLAGRVGTWALTILQSEIACKTRIFSEERGMRAEGRERGGKARTLTGYYLETVGPERFFATMGELGQALLLDTRPLFAHLRLDLNASDRFNSDLMRPDAIENPAARALTGAARHSPIPVVLGGHSIVSGGLWAMIESAWLEHDELAGPPAPAP